MAELVTIRHKQTQRERQVAKSAVAYFPDYDVLDKSGRKSSNQPTTSKES